MHLKRTLQAASTSYGNPTVRQLTQASKLLSVRDKVSHALAFNPGPCDQTTVLRLLTLGPVDSLWLIDDRDRDAGSIYFHCYTHGTGAGSEVALT